MLICSSKHKTVHSWKYNAPAFYTAIDNIIIFLVFRWETRLWTTGTPCFERPDVPDPFRCVRTTTDPFQVVYWVLHILFDVDWVSVGVTSDYPSHEVGVSETRFLQKTKTTYKNVHRFSHWSCTRTAHMCVECACVYAHYVHVRGIVHIRQPYVCKCMCSRLN